MGWSGPILTDSGGFQVFSLGDIRSVDDDGVTFRSHIDGSKHIFTPERAIQIQNDLGADIIMAFDECAKPYDRDYNMQAMVRTHSWAQRCIDAHKRDDQALFGIVQGGVFSDLRAQSARFVTELGFPGNAIGGLSVGESKGEMLAMLDVVTDILPAEKPRYLMGVGAPEDLVNGVMRGIDIFDCVLPTRLARNGSALTRLGRLNMRKREYAADSRPVVSGCTCYCCTHFTRAYVRHLFVAREILAATLLTIHNLHLLVTLMDEMREAIVSGSFGDWSEHFLRDMAVH
jgi:queuine tRNA-ribosyltransferase